MIQDRRAAFLTYNSVGRGRENGWLVRAERGAFLLQGFIRKDRSGPNLEEKRRVLGALYFEFCREAEKQKIDLLVINCGKLPNEAISMGREFCSSNHCEIIFVHCGCGEPIEPLKKDDPVGNARFIRTGCGGIVTLERILLDFLERGTVSVYATLAEILLAPGQ